MTSSILRRRMVPPSRFERLTFSLGGNCSIQLSYGGILDRSKPKPKHFYSLNNGKNKNRALLSRLNQLMVSNRTVSDILFSTATYYYMSRQLKKMTSTIRQKK